MSATTTTKRAAKTTTKAVPAQRKATPAKTTTKTAAKAPAKKAAAPVDEHDLTYFVAKTPSELHVNMAKWIEDQVGYTPDLKTVQIVCALRHTFQRSEANQNHLQNRRTSAQQAKKAAEAARKAKVLADAKKLGLL